jgi:hypothetical protein
MIGFSINLTPPKRCFPIITRSSRAVGSVKLVSITPAFASRMPCRNVFFFNLSYVCPEPVLANDRF